MYFLGIMNSELHLMYLIVGESKKRIAVSKVNKRETGRHIN